VSSGPHFSSAPFGPRTAIIVQYFASFIDFTAPKEEQAHSRQLIDELNHRVKKHLGNGAAVQSIVRRP